MNNKQFIAALAEQNGMTAKETQLQVQNLIEVIEHELQDGNTLSVSGFGVFDVKKKEERLSVNPANGVKMLIPPKLSISYKPSSLLKDKLK